MSCANVNKYVGKKLELDLVAPEIWLWCLERGIYLSAAHVPGIDNGKANEESRAVVNDDTEWSLDPIVLRKIYELHPNITIDSLRQG